MNGITPTEYTFQRTNQVVILGLKSSSVNIDGDRIQIDPLCLFQRLTTYCYAIIRWSKVSLQTWVVQLSTCSLLFLFFAPWSRQANTCWCNMEDLWKWCPSRYPRWWNSVSPGWWSTSAMHPMVLQFYIWRHLPPVHGIYSKKVQWCHSCIWWLWKYEYKRYDTSETVKRKGWCNCDGCC